MTAVPALVTIEPNPGNASTAADSASRTTGRDSAAAPPAAAAALLSANGDHRDCTASDRPTIAAVGWGRDWSCAEVSAASSTKRGTTYRTPAAAMATTTTSEKRG